MEASYTEVLTQSTLSVPSGFLYLPLTNHVSGSLSGVALVPSHLTKLLKEQCSNVIITTRCVEHTLVIWGVANSSSLLSQNVIS